MGFFKSLIRKLTKKDDSPFYSYLLLLSEPRELSRELITRTCQIAGINGTIHVVDSHLATITGSDFAVSVKSAPFPYLPKGADMEVFSDVRDLALQKALMRHVAWISIKAEVEQVADPKPALDALPKLTSALCDETTLIIWRTADDLMIIPSDEVLVLLAEGQEEEAMTKIRWDTALRAEHGDGLEAAIEEARRRFPEFATAFEKSIEREPFLAKFPFADDNGGNEHMWVNVTQVEGNTVTGQLANAPFNIKGLKEGAIVERNAEELSDWMYIEGEQLFGMFTQEHLQ